MPRRVTLARPPAQTFLLAVITRRIKGPFERLKDEKSAVAWLMLDLKTCARLRPGRTAGERSHAMTKLGWKFATAIVGLALLASASAGLCASSSVYYAGNVLAVDAATGNMVVGDMGPLQNDGRSEIARRSIVVTPSTEFTKVIRAPGVAPSRA